MAAVELAGVRKAYGAEIAVRDLSLTVAAGECLALLGPSGCGKTTTLNVLAGFVEPDAGTVRIDGRDVVGVPPHRRDAGMVFQSYALFPHLCVFDNVAFGLVMRRTPRAEVRTRVDEALALVRLAGLGHRAPRELSGGQQQRVALARALVIRPRVLLLDEPLSNLDAKLRQEMRFEIVEIQKRLAITALFVTHDQEEALAIADRVAVMRAGVIEQVDAPAALYRRPRTEFVARFIGEGNFLPGRVVSTAGGEALVEVDGGGRVVARDTERRAGERVLAMVRPEKLRVAKVAAGEPNVFPAVVRGVSFLGPVIRLQLGVGDRALQAVAHEVADVHGMAPGTAVRVAWSADDCLLLPEAADA